MSSPPSVCATRGCLLPFCWLPRSCTPPHTHPVLSAFQGRNSPNRPPRAAVQFLLRFTETLSPNTEPFWHPLLAASASEPALTQPQGTEPSRELGG